MPFFIGKRLMLNIALIWIFLFFISLQPVRAEGVGVQDKEEALLLRLRDDLNVSRQEWRDGIRSCHWPGVTCWRGHVEVLDLSGMNLTGPFPEAVCAFSELASLNLSGNHFSGRIPASVGRLHSLRQFSVRENLFSGELPAELWTLEHLVDIDASRNNISGGLSSDVGRLRNLEFLNLERNSVTGSIPAELSRCAALRVLKLDHNALEGEIPGSLGRIAGLRTMFLSFNSLYGGIPSELTELRELKILNLAYNEFSGPLPVGMEAMDSLLLVDLTWNFFNGSVPEKILPIAKTAKNCFYQIPRQHMERSCVVFYRRILSHSQGTWPEKNNGDNGSRNDVPSGVVKKRGGKNLAALVGGAGAGIGLVLVIGAVVLIVQRKERRKRASTVDTFSEGGMPERNALRNLGERFTYAQLEEATNKFDPCALIRIGRSGDFYRGVLEKGAEVVVKRIDLSRVKKEFYVRELEVFGKASHTRLVPLLGHCLEMKEEKFLVYKYMPNGDLESVMRRKMALNSRDFMVYPLDWIARLKIAIGIAEGLVYLHHECSPPIMHRDIKANSILLDDKFEVRLGSLSSAGSPDGDSQPGLVARLLAISHSWDHGESGSSAVTTANDVYCFGKLLLEILSGNNDSIECTENQGELSWIDRVLPLIDIHDKDSLPRIVDPYLIVDEDLLEEVWAVAIIAKACLNPRPSKRPTMRHVLKALENPRKIVRNDNIATRTSSYSSWNEAFGSCRSSNGSQHVIIPGTLREEYLSGGNSKGRSRRNITRTGSRAGFNDIDHTQEGGS